MAPWMYEALKVVQIQSSHCNRASVGDARNPSTTSRPRSPHFDCQGCFFFASGSKHGISIIFAHKRFSVNLIWVIRFGFFICCFFDFFFYCIRNKMNVITADGLQSTQKKVNVTKMSQNVMKSESWSRLLWSTQNPDAVFSFNQRLAFSPRVIGGSRAITATTSSFSCRMSNVLSSPGETTNWGSTEPTVHFNNKQNEGKIQDREQQSRRDWQVGY